MLTDWEFTGPDEDGYLWIDLKGETERSINLGPVDQALDKIAAILAANDYEETGEIVKWKPIDTAPRDGTRILFLAYGGKVFLGEWSDTWGSFEPEYSEVPVFNDDDGDITHWMPLPDPPAS